VTEENRRRNIAAEIERAEQAFKAAEALVGLSLFADAVSRAYYAAFHYLRALLLARGVEPKSHSGAIHLFNLEFVRVGELSNSHNRLLGSLQRSRELADYDAAVTFAPEDARDELASARDFATDARGWLEREGWWATPSK
jgi:uncharacterized protein (UPF0332 family)